MKIELVDRGIAPQRMTDGSVGYDCFAREVELHYQQLYGMDAALEREGLITAKGPYGATIKLGFKIDTKWHRFINNVEFGAFLFPRSGWAKKCGFKLKNTIGVIDPDYRGEVIAEVEFDECPQDLVIFANSPCNGCIASHACKSCSEFEYSESQPRVCQMIFLPCYVGELTQIDKLDETERGGGGFGSTNE